MKYDYDCIVIGGGSAGLTAAFTAAGLGKRVAIAEKHRIGGECTWSGCVPSKALIAAAHAAHTARRGGEYGLGIELQDSSGVMDSVRKVVAGIYAHESPDVLQSRGVAVLEGAAAFEDAHTVAINGARHTAAKFIIACGSVPFVPQLPGLDTVDYLTNESFFELSTLPASLTVLGGGPIGLELAQALRRLDVAVNIVELAPRVLPREDAEAAAVIAARLEAEGVRIITGAEAVRAEREGDDAVLVYRHDRAEQRVRAGKLLVAVGRAPGYAGLHPERAGVKVNARGIITDAYLRTSAKHIYAAGDIAGPYQLSHMAGHQGMTAALNAFLPLRRRAEREHVPWCVFTDPELARSGLTEEEARARGAVKVFRYNAADIDRYRAERETDGFIKYITDRKYRILGVHIVASSASELIMEGHLARHRGIRLPELYQTIHPYPIRGDLNRQAAKLAALDRIANNPVVRLVKALRGGRR